MTFIRITFRDGTKREWRHEGRAGGGWTKTVQTEEGWVTVRDEYGGTVSYPSDIVLLVETKE